MKFSVIIPVYGQWVLAKNCLLSLKKYINVPFEVIFVDNGYKALPDCPAASEAPALGKELFGENFVYLPQEVNLNFSGACNLGARSAKSDLLFFLNSDTEILENAIEPILEAIKDPNELKMYAPILVYPPNEKEKDYTIQHLGVAINPLNQVLHLYEFFPISHPVVERKRDLQVITAAAFFIHKEHYFKLNGFDEEFKNGFEDVDLCGRFNAIGGKYEIITQSKIVHLCSQSIGRSDSSMYNSQVLLRKEGIKHLHEDLHKQYLEDGFDLHLNEFLTLAPCLGEERKNALQTIIDSDNLVLIKTMHSKEPFWHEGLWAILQHKEMSNLDKVRYIFKLSNIFIEPAAFIEYAKLTASIMPVSVEEINALLTEQFYHTMDISKDVSEQDFPKVRMYNLNVFLESQKKFPYLIEDCKKLIENNDNFLQYLQEQFEILRTLVK